MKPEGPRERGGRPLTVPILSGVLGVGAGPEEAADEPRVNEPRRSWASGGRGRSALRQADEGEDDQQRGGDDAADDVALGRDEPTRAVSYSSSGGRSRRVSRTRRDRITGRRRSRDGEEGGGQDSEGPDGVSGCEAAGAEFPRGGFGDELGDPSRSSGPGDRWSVLAHRVVPSIGDVIRQFPEEGVTLTPGSRRV